MWSHSKAWALMFSSEYHETLSALCFNRELVTQKLQIPTTTPNAPPMPAQKMVYTPFSNFPRVLQIAREADFLFRVSVILHSVGRRENLRLPFWSSLVELFEMQSLHLVYAHCLQMEERQALHCLISEPYPGTSRSTNWRRETLLLTGVPSFSCLQQCQLALRVWIEGWSMRVTW